MCLTLYVYNVTSNATTAVMNFQKFDYNFLPVTIGQQTIGFISQLEEFLISVIVLDIYKSPDFIQTIISK